MRTGQKAFSVYPSIFSNLTGLTTASETVEQKQKMCFGFTSLGLVLFIFVDEQETGTLGAEREQDALDDCRDEGEAQKERPQIAVPHD